MQEIGVRQDVDAVGCHTGDGFEANQYQLFDSGVLVSELQQMLCVPFMNGSSAFDLDGVFGVADHEIDFDPAGQAPVGELVGVVGVALMNG